MRTVVVTGIAGTLGSRVGGLLRAEGARVVGVDLAAAVEALRLGRSDAVDPAGEGAGDVELVALDLAGSGGESLAAVASGADAIVHLAWQIPEGPGSRRRRHRANEANRRGLDRVLAAAAEAGVGQVVLVSSATVYGAWPDNPVPLSEDAPLRPNPAFAFAVGKAEAERTVTEWAQGHPGVAVAVLRPAVTVGGAERPLYQALGATRAPRGADRNRPVQYLHVDDLASAVLVVLARRLAGVFNVAPDAGISEDTARALAGGLARVALPARLAGAVAAWTWDLWRSGIPKEALPYSLHPWVVAADRLRAEGWRPRYSSEEALVATDVRPHWDDLPPGRRQNYTMAAIGAGALAVVGATVAIVVSWRRSRRAP
jgi:nucleoside-diphosphate-sugar epimerase